MESFKFGSTMNIPPMLIKYEFLLCKNDLEKLHNAKINVIKMYRPFFMGDYKVEYEIIKEDKENA